MKFKYVNIKEIKKKFILMVNGYQPLNQMILM